MSFEVDDREIGVKSLFPEVGTGVNWLNRDNSNRLDVAAIIKSRLDVNVLISKIPENGWSLFSSGSEEIVIMKSCSGRVRVLHRSGKLKSTELLPKVVGDTLLEKEKPEYSVNEFIWVHRKVFNRRK